MWEMVSTSVIAFFKGTLFARPLPAYGLLGVGVGVSAIVFLGTRQLGVPTIGAAALAGLTGGALQPRLYKKLKYR